MSNTAVNEKEVTPIALNQGDLKDTEVSRVSKRILVKDIETTVEDVVKPEYWVNVGEVLSEKNNNGWRFPIIEMIWADGSLYLELIVMDAGRLFAKVKVLRCVYLDELNSITAPVSLAVAGDTVKNAIDKLNRADIPDGVDSFDDDSEGTLTEEGLVDALESLNDDTDSDTTDEDTSSPELSTSDPKHPDYTGNTEVFTIVGKGKKAKKVYKDYTIKWVSPHSKFSVIRNSDKKELQTNLTTREEAEEYTEEFIKAMD